MADQADRAGSIARTHGFDASKPNVARIYDYLLGGKDNFAVDRDAAQRLTEALPNAAAVARANRVFLAAAVRHVAGEGITQYVDIGAGLPTSPSVHECARAVIPGAQVVYVDNDPVAVSHGQALLETGDGVITIKGDAREPETILADSRLAALIDMSQPVCVLLRWLRSGAARTGTRRRMGNRRAGRAAAAAGTARAAAGEHAGRRRTQADRDLLTAAARSVPAVTNRCTAGW